MRSSKIAASKDRAESDVGGVTAVRQERARCVDFPRIRQRAGALCSAVRRDVKGRRPEGRYGRRFRRSLRTARNAAFDPGVIGPDLAADRADLFSRSRAHRMMASKSPLCAFEDLAKFASMRERTSSLLWRHRRGRRVHDVPIPSLQLP